MRKIGHSAGVTLQNISSLWSAMSTLSRCTARMMKPKFTSCVAFTSRSACTLSQSSTNVHVLAIAVVGVGGGNGGGAVEAVMMPVVIAVASVSCAQMVLRSASSCLVKSCKGSIT
eukprot:3360531-Ditylum_brightwellii.AAC.1